MAKWTAADIPDLSGREAVVTGANSGLGFQTALELARHGARVVMACRDQGRGAQAVDRVRAAAPGAQVELGALDLAELASVRRFAAWYRERREREGLDLLVNNAGVMAIPHRRTADGFEMQLGTNHLGHFALTGLLLPLLTARPGARVVTVSSIAHRAGWISFGNLQRERRYERWTAYGQAKLANLLFAFELQRRADAVGVDLLSMAAHPGYAATNLQAVGPQMSGARLSARLFDAANRVVAQSGAGRLALALCRHVPRRAGRRLLRSRWAGRSPGLPYARQGGAARLRRTHGAPPMAGLRGSDGSALRQPRRQNFAKSVARLTDNAGSYTVEVDYSICRCG